jgi:hypothetical protein
LLAVYVEEQMKIMANDQKNPARFVMRLVLLILAIFAVFSIPICASSDTAGTAASIKIAMATDKAGAFEIAMATDKAGSFETAIATDKAGSIEMTAAADATETTVASEAPASARKPRAAKVSLADAVATAEKMYYCGELYIFADSMIKANYNMASISESIKDSIQNGSLTRNRVKLNSLTAKYNDISAIFNSWVDVKGDLEYFIDVIGTRNAISKSQLQTAFKRTLTTIDDTRGLLETAEKYYADQTVPLKLELSGAADRLTASAAGAVKSIGPIAEKSISGYRSLFDQFAAQSGLNIEYKTWQNPEDPT